jgi:hypothetical protein
VAVDIVKRIKRRPRINPGPVRQIFAVIIMLWPWLGRLKAAATRTSQAISTIASYLAADRPFS